VPRPDVPCSGVNLGRLGFLAEVELDDLGPALRAVVDGGSGRGPGDPRGVVTARTAPSLGSGLGAQRGLVEKTARQRLLLMDVHVDGTLFAKVPADALILATATGSTAYALSAGGPIVSPKLEATLVVPVAPHSLFDRTVVAAPTRRSGSTCSGTRRPALVSCDGREPVVPPGSSSRRAAGAARSARARRGDSTSHRWSAASSACGDAGLDRARHSAVGPPPARCDAR
jgi:NAD+ kinase